MPKVLIAYSDAGNGPLSASTAIKKGIELLYSNRIQTVLVDVLRQTNQSGFQAVRLYNYFLSRNLRLNQLGLRLFYNSELAKSGKLLSLHLEKLTQLISDERPEAIAITNPWVAGYICKAVQSIKGQRPVLISVIVDIGESMLPPSWVQDEIDYYIVPIKEAKAGLVRLGASEPKIRVLGMPVDPKFLENGLTRQHEIKRCPKCSTRPNILVLGGRAGTPNTLPIFKALLKSDLDCHLTIQCGKNKRLRRKIDRHIQNSKHSDDSRHIVVLDFVPDLHQFMEQADVIISKPGALTVSESVCLKVPLILDTSVVMAQEVGNVIFVEKHKLGLSAKEPKLIPPLVMRVINEDYKSQISLASNNSLGGTIDIAEFIGGLACGQQVQNNERSSL